MSQTPACMLLANTLAYCSAALPCFPVPPPCPPASLGADKVDVVSWKKKSGRVHAQIKDMCAILCGECEGGRSVGDPVPSVL